jgi:Primase C terminal 1 (PriCT-1)
VGGRLGKTRSCGPIGVQRGSVARRFRRRGMGESEILAALDAVNRERGKPPLTADELQRIAASAATSQPNNWASRPTTGRPASSRRWVEDGGPAP